MTEVQIHAGRAVLHGNLNIPENASAARAVCPRQRQQPSQSAESICGTHTERSRTCDVAI